MRLLATTLLTLLLANGPALSGELFIVCHTDVTLQSADVRDLFLGDKQFSGSVHLVPVDNAAQQPAFLERVLKMSAAKYSTGWTKKAFRDGLTPPLVLGSDAEALAYVRRTSGACTYASTRPADLSLVASF